MLTQLVHHVIGVDPDRDWITLAVVDAHTSGVVAEGRCHSEAAFARLGGTSPVEATSGQNQTRHRLNRGGDRQLNRALYHVAITKQRCDPATKSYIARRTADGKTEREAIRCIKRFIARRVWRLLEHPSIAT